MTQLYRWIGSVFGALGRVMLCITVLSQAGAPEKTPVPSRRSEDMKVLLRRHQRRATGARICWWPWEYTAAELRE